MKLTTIASLLLSVASLFGEDAAPDSLARVSRQHSSQFGQTVLSDAEENPEGRAKLTLLRNALKADAEMDGQSGRMVGEKSGLAQAMGRTMESTSMQPYKAKNFEYLYGMPGFSEKLLSMHFQLYQGYVKNTNLLLGILQQYAGDGKDRTPQYAEIKRRLMWEFDGMRLHEDYFGNLGGKGTQLNPSSPLYQRMQQDFGSFDKWKEDFIATGAMRGIGWAILYLDPVSGRLINTWINEHDKGHLAGGEPILIMDVFEHAYMPQYGLDRMKYIDAFFDNIDWDVVAKRYPSKKKT